MSQPEPSRAQSSPLDTVLLSFGERISDVRQQIYYCDANSLRRDTRLVRMALRAHAYVELGAAVEVFVREVGEALVAEITAASVESRDLRVSLTAISKGGSFRALSDVRGLKNWRQRCEVLNAIESSEIAELDSAHLPLDGRTIRPQHFNSIWEVFGLPGDALPSPLHALALNDLADSRNDVAHGNEEIASVAGRRSTTDMLKLVSRIEDIGTHVWNQASDYLHRRMYRRMP